MHQTRFAPKTAPRWVCIVSADESLRLADVAIDHRCAGSTHAHYRSHKVKEMVALGMLKWVGKHRKIAAWTEERTWAKTMSGPVAVMQLVRGLRR